MLTDLCQELRNWFDRERHFGTFQITGGVLTVPFLQDNQYYRIVGSVFNDGVHQYGVDPLEDETFEGAIWTLAIPEAVIKLSEDIDAWSKKYAAPDGAAMSPFVSESFGGYSYSKGASNSSTGVSASDWTVVFGSRLNRWRKI